MIALLAAGSAVLLGPAVSAEWTGRVHLETLQQGPDLRHYRVYRPARLQPSPGLVFDLHPSGTDGLVEEAETRFDAQADRLGWIVVYPDALAEGWQRYGCCDGAEEDVAFIAGVIARLEASDAVDPGRVYVTGTSRGGMMAYRLGCELSDRLAAVAPVAGNMADANGRVEGVDCRPGRPISVLAIHGSDDTAVPIAGGAGFAPMAAVIDRWRGLDGCTPSPSTSVRGPAVTTTWHCRAGSEVQSIVVSGGRHGWPGTPLASLPWAPGASLDASRVIADFFAAHRRAPAAS